MAEIKVDAEQLLVHIQSLQELQDGLSKFGQLPTASDISYCFDSSQLLYNELLNSSSSVYKLISATIIKLEDVKARFALADNAGGSIDGNGVVGSAGGR